VVGFSGHNGLWILVSIQFFVWLPFDESPASVSSFQIDNLDNYTEVPGSVLENLAQREDIHKLLHEAGIPWMNELMSCGNTWSKECKCPNSLDFY